MVLQPGKNVDQTANIGPFKRDSKRTRGIAMDITSLTFCFFHIVTKISCTKGCHQVYTTKLLNS